MPLKASTYCNPLNLSYRFQVRGWTKGCMREAADPSVVFYQGEHWLFASKSGGYWHSKDLKEWIFVETHALPVEDYAPDVRVINGALYCTASRGGEKCPIFRTVDPKADKWEKISEPFVFWDPNLFQDDDGRVYFYWGCSDTKPIYGVEMDPVKMEPIGEPVALIHGNLAEHGWERASDDNLIPNAPYIEGAWMTKHNGVYYLQYAAPGTEWNIYADGVYTSASPLGPFTYVPQNPFSFKPGGFITGAGHGSTFWDTYGNLWHIATMRISVKHIFERCIGLFPAGFDADGVLYCNNSFGDYPVKYAEGKWNPWSDPTPGWMLLSYEKKVTASSSLPDHPTAHSVNEDIRNYWSAVSGNAGEWLQVELGETCTVHAVQIDFAEHECNQYAREGAPLHHRYLLEASTDGEKWFIIGDQRDNNRDVPHDYLELGAPADARFIKLTNQDVMPGGGKFAVSGLRVFGHGAGQVPAAVGAVETKAVFGDPLAVGLSWEGVEGSTGYNIQWGISPGKLYNSWLVYGQTGLTLRALNKGPKYWVRVDAFNENGVSRGSIVPVV